MALNGLICAEVPFRIYSLTHSPKGNPVSAGVKYTGVGKFVDFRLKLPSISETVRHRPMVTMEH